MSFTSPTSSIPSSTPSSLDLHLHLHLHYHHHHHLLCHLHHLHHLQINLIYMTHIIYNAYMTYIIIYITASSTSPTSSNLSNLTSLTTSSSSSTTWTTSPTSATGGQLLGNSYKTWNMSFTQELACRWSTSTWTATRLLPARSLAQKLLHMSCYTGVQLTSRWSNCIWTPARADFSSSSISLAGTARRWLTKCYPLRRVDACRTPKRVAKCGSCLSLGNPLRRSHVSDGQTCGVVKCETSLPAATVCGDRAFRTPKHVVECECLLGTGNPLQRSRRLDIQTCGKMQIWRGPATIWWPNVKNLRTIEFFLKCVKAALWNRFFCGKASVCKGFSV